jgi:hypothetical protein
MRKTVVPSAIAAVTVFAAVWYFARESTDQTTESPAAAERGANHVAENVQGAGRDAEPARSSSGPANADPRLEVFAVSPDNGLIEFVRAPDGKVIMEIDKDPSSPSYRKPLREYSYAGNHPMAVTDYRYVGGKVQVIRTLASYKPDGSVDQIKETTSDK